MKIRKIKKRDKRAVSLMLSYVLLIVITISLAVGIYAWLRFTVIQPKIPKCSEDVALIIKDYSCDGLNKKIILNVENKGFFNIDGFFARGTSDETQIAIFPLKVVEYTGQGLDIPDGKYIFSLGSESALKPNENKSIEFSFASLGGSLEKAELEPFRTKDTGDVLCNAATITQKIDCAAHAEEAPEQGVPPQSLISWWRFENDLTDAGIGGNDGSAVGTVQFVASSVSGSTYALYLPNVADHVQVLHNSNLNPLSDFTIDFYFNTLFASNIINKQGDYSVTINSGSNTISADVGGTMITSGSAMSPGIWNHVVIIIDNNVLKMILNENLQTDSKTITTLPTGINDLLIGNGYSGQIDELKIYNYATQ